MITDVMQCNGSEEDMPCIHMTKQQPNRVKRHCPLPGCESKAPFVRLANHIHSYHKITSREERRMWLNKARQNVRFGYTIILKCF